MLDVETIVNRLHKLRSDLAKKAGKGQYGSFNDQILIQIVMKRPKTLEELATIKGLPLNGKRVQGFGQAILDCVNKEDYESTEIKDTEDGIVLETVHLSTSFS